MKKLLLILQLLSCSAIAMISGDNQDFYLGVEIHNFTSHTIEYKNFLSKTGQVVGVDPLEQVNNKSLKVYVKFPPQSFLEFSPKYLHPQLYEIIKDGLVIQESYVGEMRIAPQHFLSFEINKQIIEFSFFNLRWNYGNNHRSLYSSEGNTCQEGYNIYLISNHYCYFNSNFSKVDGIEFSLIQSIYFDDLVKEKKDFSINYLTTITLKDKLEEEVQKVESTLEIPLLISAEDFPINSLIKDKKDAKQKWKLAQKNLTENINKANELTSDESKMESKYKNVKDEYYNDVNLPYNLPPEIVFLHTQVEENRKKRVDKFINECKKNQRDYEDLKEKIKALRAEKKE